MSANVSAILLKPHISMATGSYDRTYNNNHTETDMLFWKERNKKQNKQKTPKKQGKSEGYDSCDRPSNLTQIGLKPSTFWPIWP